MTVGENIKKARKKSGLSQKELGEKLGVSQVMISAYENGTRNPKLETIQRISDALNTAISNILTGEYLMQGNVTKKDFKDWVELLPQSKSDRLDELFNLLNDIGKDKAIEQVEMLTKIPEYQKETTKRVEELAEIPRYTNELAKTTPYEEAQHEEIIDYWEEAPKTPEELEKRFGCVKFDERLG